MNERPPRFRLPSNRDTMRLLFTMVRDGRCTVEQAMECIVEEGPSHPAVTCPHDAVYNGKCDQCGATLT